MGNRISIKAANYCEKKIELASITIASLKRNKKADTTATKTSKTRKRHRQESAKQRKVTNMSNLTKKNNEVKRETTTKNKASEQTYT